MKIYKQQNVLQAAKERFRYLFNEFDKVIVGFSGGKDSTTIFNLSLKTAKKLNKLPLKVLFIDQEAEWQHTIDYVKKIMYMDEVEPYWLQVPIKLFNATSHTENWLYCWDIEQKDKWIHKKDKISIKDNRYKTDRFKQMFTNFMDVEFKNKSACIISGVRTEESPARFLGLTQMETYKGITWGKRNNKKENHYSFYPIYDWTYKDIWKYIYENKLEYNKIYDYQYRYGLSIYKMRVSNVHHETALNALHYMHEVEKNTWNKLVKRLSGINTNVKMEKENMSVYKLPYMFRDWKEYRDYLLENLIQDEKIKNRFRRKFKSLDKLYIHKCIKPKINKVCVNSIIRNDYYLTKIQNELARPGVGFYRQWRQGKKKLKDIKKNRHAKFIIDAIKEDNENIRRNKKRNR